MNKSYSIKIFTGPAGPGLSLSLQRTLMQTKENECTMAAKKVQVGDKFRHSCFLRNDIDEYLEAQNIHMDNAKKRSVADFILTHPGKGMSVLTNDDETKIW